MKTFYINIIDSRIEKLVGGVVMFLNQTLKSVK